jgi:DNA-binding NtrC family response regulator
MPQYPTDLEEHSLDGKTVMLAEDEDRLRTIVTMMLEELGAEAITVADGESAIEEYRRCPEEIDVVLLDVRMTGLNGVTTFRRILELDSNAKVVLSSGVLPEDSLIQEIMTNGGSFIEKPFNLAQLSAAIAKILEGELVVWTL